MSWCALRPTTNRESNLKLHASCPEPGFFDRRGSLSATSSELLKLYERAVGSDLAAFEVASVRQLGHLVGFDGAVWGSGKVRASGGDFQISHATVIDRPTKILADYGHVCHRDPVTRTFVAHPEHPQTIDVDKFYGTTALKGMREFLHEYRVGHLLLNGVYAQRSRSMSWLTVYRGATDKTFSDSDATLLQALLPHWMQARDVCAALDAARSAVAHAAPGPASCGAHGGECRSTAAESLSAREAEVLCFVARGCTYVETAAHMGLAVSTVRTHARNLYVKLGVHNKTEAVFEARQAGWLT